MEFFSLLVVLAITYNQGAARPAHDKFGYITKNDVAFAEGFRTNSDDGTVFKIPTNIREGDIITIHGTLKMKDKSFTVVFPSSSAKQDCQIKYDFESGTIDITPSGNGYEVPKYNLSFSLDSKEAPTFSLWLIARVNEQGQEIFGITFNGNNAGESAQLICHVESFEDIENIVMKEGVERIRSLQFDYRENR